MTLHSRLSECTLCADRFAATATRHRPKPVVWFRPRARLLICSQAPGMRAHQSRIPFDDPSGDRLRAWLGLDRSAFYDQTKVAIVPMGFCFPGYNAAGSDLPPPAICRQTWHDEVLTHVGPAPLKLVIGGYAQKYHLGTKTSVTDVVRQWRTYGPDLIPLPHPSWRNTAWLKKHPWFEEELLPVLRNRVQEVLA
ncbi:uracil-DNA glycosylase family protein [Marivita sp. S0852]|uniref:uracil-DNA glycosylase family protein n=1 Tax=Marivita sp. S0852 TaxID=3373893 RepID=UPI003981D0E6